MAPVVVSDPVIATLPLMFCVPTKLLEPVFANVKLSLPSNRSLLFEYEALVDAKANDDVVAFKAYEALVDAKAYEALVDAKANDDVVAFKANDDVVAFKA